MKIFITNLLNFALIGSTIILILFFLYLFLDPFKVINSYETLYDDNDKVRVNLNKDYVSTTTFVKNIKDTTITYNSFIFGNSRSVNYRIGDWEKYLLPQSNCFHFDAFGEALWAINKKIEFIDHKGMKIKNALLILDYETLIQDKPKSGHLYIITPILVNNKNIIDFHVTFFKAFLSPKFMYAYIDFKISGEVKPYMIKRAMLDDMPINYNMKTNEIKYDYLESLIETNQYYTPERLTDFYKRDSTQQYSPISIRDNQKLILRNIHNIFKNHGTDIKIIINPLYDQVKINSIDLRYLKLLFGQNNVYDFSGINKITNDYTNYYEISHYRPIAARQIIEKIYNKNIN